jgi:hypothetical protein
VAARAIDRRQAERLSKAAAVMEGTSLFTAEERARVRSELLAHARKDCRISGAAITGSAAVGGEDRWSDIDLAFGVSDGAQVSRVLSDWTAHVYEQHGALHHLDIRAGAWIYRVFLFASTLQVDLAFVPAAEFRALSPTFQLMFGKASERQNVAAQQPGDIIGFGWLYALHARSSISRGKLWQAEYMISGIRDHALALACVRHGFPAIHGRGFDLLPAAVTARFAGALVQQLDRAELARAFGVAIEGLVDEICTADPHLGRRLEGALRICALP